VDGVLGFDEIARNEFREALREVSGSSLALGVIPSSVHGIFDYLLAGGAIAAPYLFGFADTTAGLVLQLEGGIVLLYSICTDYRLGAIRIIPFRIHLVLDSFAALFLAVSPNRFGFRRGVKLSLGLAAAELLIDIFTKRQTGR
ncbi:MAG TPA: hypothetical protein VND64_07870, partial [Pirellulales bacterium]|nr:hypothetical protein [Pirellulales bacterium]